MEFFKKHYEKILLGVVLVGLVVAVAYLPVKISSERKKLEDLSSGLTHPNVKPLTNLDLSMPANAVKRMDTPVALDFGEPNRLFNPRRWLKTADNRLIPAATAGPMAAAVTNITPLYLKLTLDNVNVTADGTARYGIGVEKQASPKVSDRTKKQTYVKMKEGNETFSLESVQGKPEEPTSVTLVLKDTGEAAVISKEKEFSRVDGYTADIKYPPGNRFWKAQRVGANLNLNGEDYKIVAITRNEVVLSAPNQKKWTIKFNAG
jgi:hypothetical protein